MGHEQGSGGAEFDGEVAVGDGIEGVQADPVEAQLGGHGFPVDGVGGAG